MVDNLYTDPKSWGHHFWYVMRCIAFNYSEQPSSIDKQDVKLFYDNLKNLLPCEKCRKHYNMLLSQFPLRRSICCRSCLINWVEKIYQSIEKS